MASGEEYLAALEEITRAIERMGGSINRVAEQIQWNTAALVEIKVEIKRANDMVKELRL